MEQEHKSRRQCGMESGKECDPCTFCLVLASCGVVRALRELGIFFDEDGQLRYVKNNDRISMSNLTVDPLRTVTAITQYVCA